MLVLLLISAENRQEVFTNGMLQMSCALGNRAAHAPTGSRTHTRPHGRKGFVRTVTLGYAVDQCRGRNCEVGGGGKLLQSVSSLQFVRFRVLLLLSRHSAEYLFIDC